MKHRILFSIILLGAMSVVPLSAEPPTFLATSDPTVAELGPHHRVWQRTSQFRTSSGKIVTRTNSYVELATGLHYQKDGQWLESKEAIDLFEGGAIARQGQHQVIFAPNINTAGAIDLLTPDGKRFRSHILGLAYTDAATGKAAMIAEIKDSIGQLVAPNQIIYPDAFTDLKADIRYTYTKAGFEQDVILREEPPSPLVYGLNPATTRLEVYTEFLDPPTPSKSVSVIKQEFDPVLRAMMFEPDLVDERLDFGVMFIGTGDAFALDDAAAITEPETAVPVGKSWEQREGRNLLIEKVEYSSIQRQLLQLPKGAALNKPKRAVANTGDEAQDKSLLVQFSSPPDRAKGSTPPIQMARTPNKEKGFVLDYQQLNANTNDFVFRSDTTYFITAQVNLSGTTRLEGGTVIKNTNGTTVKRLVIQGPLDCRTSPYRPAIFTGKNDDTVGEIIPGSTGNPTTNYFGQYLELSTNVQDLHHVHLRHPYYGILLGGAQATISDVQICRMNTALVPGSGVVKLRNALIYDGTYGIGGLGAGSYFEQVTFHRLINLRSSSYTTVSTNCLFIAVTNNVTLSGANNYTNRDETGIFQTVGSATHYLATNSPHRNSGTTNINPGLLTILKKRTTYPPIVLTNDITTNTTLTAQALRDTDGPDLGYHYHPLDYVFNKVALSNANLTLTPGTALGTYGAEYGLWLYDGANLVSEGAADNLCCIVRYNLVQEQANTNWSSLGVGVSIKSLDNNWLASPYPTARFRFTDFAMPASGGYHFYIPWAFMPTVLFQDCQLLGGGLYFDLAPVAFTNCLFERMILEIFGNSGAEYHNNLFYGGWLLFDSSSGLHTFTDNLFDGITLNQYGDPIHSNNGYSTNVIRLTPHSSTDVVVTNLVYQKGPLGNFYLPATSPLLNTGSVASAASVGLYHHTTTTNQVKETNSVLDIGFHYVALSGLNPVDSDSDGIADQIEDKNGNGLVESNETSFTDSDTDYDGRVDGQELLDGTNPLDASSVLPSFLAAWMFHDTNFTGLQGQLTKVCTNVQSITLSSNAVLQIHTNVPAQISYRDVETNGLPNINCRNGTVRFWFKPNWSSTTAGGSGPGSMGRLLEVGEESTNAAYGQWVICLNTNGTELGFCTQGEGVSTTNVSGAISWISNQWHQIALTYTPTNSRLHIDGQIISDGTGVQHFPPAAARKADGMMIGSNKGGNRQGRGQYDNLETYNYPLISEEIASSFAESVAAIQCFCTAWSGNVPYFTLFPSGNPEPAGVGELIFRNVYANLTSQVITRQCQCCDGVGHCTGWQQQVANWGGTMQAVAWATFSEPALPSTGTVPGSGPSFSIPFVVTQSGTMNLGGGAQSGAPIPGSQINVIGTQIKYLVLAPLLGSWHFNEHLTGDQGHFPSTALNVESVPGLTGSAILLNVGSKLIYPAFNWEGAPTIKRNRGTIRFWFKPTWSSTTVAGGTGPGTAARLIEMQGDTTWSLRLNANGTAVELYTSASGGTSTLAFSRTIDWTAGQWHQIVVTYESFVWGVNGQELFYIPSSTDLYIDGTLNRTGTPLNSPGTANLYAQERVSSFSIGSDAAGASPAKGAFDELETFNWLLTGTVIATDYQTVAGVDSDGDGWTDLIEINNGTDPTEPDTDGDGVPDPTDTYPLDPWNRPPGTIPPPDTTPPIIDLLVPPIP